MRGLKCFALTVGALALGTLSILAGAWLGVSGGGPALILVGLGASVLMVNHAGSVW